MEGFTYGRDMQKRYQRFDNFKHVLKITKRWKIGVVGTWYHDDHTWFLENVVVIITHQRACMVIRNPCL